jgi:hypothetical protein
MHDNFATMIDKVYPCREAGETGPDDVRRSVDH